MTAPWESIEALKRGPQMLAIIANDELTTAAARACARQLLQLHPAEDHLDAFIATGAESLPRWEALLSATAALFRILAVWDQGSETTKRALESMLRHYPEASLPSVLGSQRVDPCKWSLRVLMPALPAKPSPASTPSDARYSSQEPGRLAHGRRVKLTQVVGSTDD
jgi:hypothetical protein